MVENEIEILSPAPSCEDSRGKSGSNRPLKPNKPGKHSHNNVLEACAVVSSEKPWHSAAKEPSPVRQPPTVHNCERKT
jgi:hypothetical protein